MIHTLLIIIQIINIITVLYMILREDRSPYSIISWTLILYLAPAIGFVLFLLLGRRIGNSNMFGIKDAELKVLESHIIDERESLRQNTELKNSDMIRFISEIGYFPYREGVDINLYSHGEYFFGELLKCIREAKHSINIQFYIFKNDDIGSKILNELEKKAKDGVEVRLLYDSVGSRSLNKKVLNNIINAGGKVGEFFSSWLKLININMNFRNHRKIVVIDNTIGFVGGFNVGDEYLGKNKKFGYWRDTHIKIKGSAVHDLNLRFLADWRYATKEDISLDSILEYPDDISTSENGVQIISSGPNLENTYEIKLAYLKMIQRAKKYVYIQSPYLILDRSIIDSLKISALSGVDVKIMIPGKGDHPFVYWANLFYAGDLIKSGVKVYHYDENAFLHAKTVVIDDKICSIGTANMDTRSFELNFEINALLYSKDISKKQREAFENDLLNSKELTLNDYNNRSLSIKVKESFSRLFSNVL
ncbi:MAG: cardiolipin synthase [Clostridium sp.]|nr:cardiolipin synthase [Clostridium sp.]